MAKRCTYTIDGVSYSEQEFKAHLLDGALDTYAKDGSVSIKGLEVEKKKPTRQDIARGLNELLNKGKEKLALEGDVNPQTRRTFQQLGIKQGDTIQTVVDRIIEEGGEYADLLRTIRADQNFKNLQAEFIDDRKGGDNGESGLYYPTENRLQIWNKDNVKYTIAHELMHWFTLDSQAANELKDTPSYKAIDDLYNYLASKKSKPVAGLATMESYGLTNVKEFMAELLINPTFRTYVSDVFAESKDDILKTSKSIRDSKATGIIDLIRDFFTELFNSLVGKDNSIPFDEKKPVVENAVNLMKDLFFSDKYTNLEKTSQNADDFITGKKVFERFSQEEQRGFAEGGTSHVEASLLLARSKGASGQDNTTSEAQENSVEAYAKENGIWTDNTTENLTEKYGEPIAAGEEAIVWFDPQTGNVIKTQDTFQYDNLQEKLDGITLHNTYFPEASLKVIGFGRNSQEEFQVIVEQPFIQGEKLTKKEIDEYLTNLGFTADDNGHFSNDQTIIEDVHTGNAIKDKDGNIIVIDPIMRLNTPEQGYGGKRNINQNTPLALPSQFNPEEVNPIINQYVKGLIEQGVDEQTIKDGLTDFGLTEEEANKFISDNQPPKPPKEKTESKEEDFENKPKAILNRIFESKNISQYVKDSFQESGLRYNPQSHDVARKIAKNIIAEFGTEDAVAMAESGRFDGDVNSMIFAEAIDQTYQKEQEATSLSTKQRYADQWADFTLRYDETARQKGKFISAVYDFYKKSPLGVIIAEKARRSETFNQWFKTRNKPFKEVFDEISTEPEFKAFVQEQVSSQLKEERAATRQKRRKKIEDIFDAAKIKKDGLNSSLIPPPIWNGAMEVMKQAALAGESLVSVVEAGINHIKENHKEAFNEEELTQQWREKFKSIDSSGKQPPSEKELQERLLDKFRKRLSGLNDKQKEDVIRRSFKQLVENGALEYADFKKIVADVMGLGELKPEEIAKINQYVKDINEVQDAADNVLKERTPKSIDKFYEASKKAEKAATELGHIVNNKPELINRVRSIIQLNTLGVISLIKNPFYNIFYQTLVRFPKATLLTALDQSIYGISMLANKALGTPTIKPDTNIFLSQKGYFKKAGKGTKESVQQVFTGMTNMDYFQKEVRTAQIKPLQSWRDIWDYKKGDKYLSGAQVADKVIQGTVGIPAEMVARMLNIGDKPFRYAAEGAVAETIAAQEFGLKNGIDKDIFIAFPKDEAKRLYLQKGLSEEDATKKAEAIEKRIVDEGEQAVFQQKNIITEGLNGLGAMMKNFAEDKPVSKGFLGAAKILGTLNAPFLKTPLNIFWDLFNLAAPEVAIAQSSVYGVLAGKAKYDGDSVKAKEYLQQSKKWMAHAAVGYSLLVIAGYFASIGAVSGADDDEASKERKGKKTYQRPRSLNASKVMRAIFGGSTQDEDEDLMVDLSWYGIPGVVLNMQANRMENMSQQDRDNSSYLYNLFDRMHDSAAEGLENSIFQNSIAGLEAFKQGGRWTNTWLLNQINVGTNFFQPATAAQFSRALLPYNYTIKSDTFGDEVKNTFQARSWLFRQFTGNPPSDITIWGDEAKRNNTGVKGVAFNMLGWDEYNKDAFAEPVFQDFKRTGNSSFFPTDVKTTITVDGQSKEMNAEEAKRFKTLVGQARKSLVAPFVNESAYIESKDPEIDGKRYNELSDAQKVKALNSLYKKGYEIGKSQFTTFYPEFQTQKQKESQEEE